MNCICCGCPEMWAQYDGEGEVDGWACCYCHSGCFLDADPAEADLDTELAIGACCEIETRLVWSCDPTPRAPSQWLVLESHVKADSEKLLKVVGSFEAGMKWVGENLGVVRDWSYTYMQARLIQAIGYDAGRDTFIYIDSQLM